jgi:hypothetical protein
VQGIGDVLAAVGDVLEDRLAQRLGRHRARVDGDAADALTPLHDGDALAELRRLDRGPLAARARTDDEHVEVARGVGHRLRP